MNIYNVILKAADHIERYPNDFAFGAIRIPGGCGTPGCALGWIGHYSREDYRWFSDALRLLGMHASDEFYLAMSQALNPKATSYSGPDSAWMRDPALCAKAMRIFAERYRAKPDAFKPWLADLMRKVEGETIPA